MDPLSSNLSSSSKAALRSLLDETADLIESPPFAQVLALLNNEAFSHLVDSKCASQAFGSSALSAVPTPSSHSQSNQASSLDLRSTFKTKLANVLAVVTKQTHIIGNGTNPPNEYLTKMEGGVKELEAFAAVIYSSNFESVIAPMPEEPTQPTQPTQLSREQH